MTRADTLPPWLLRGALSLLGGILVFAANLAYQTISTLTATVQRQSAQIEELQHRADRAAVGIDQLWDRALGIK